MYSAGQVLQLIEPENMRSRSKQFFEPLIYDTRGESVPIRRTFAQRIFRALLSGKALRGCCMFRESQCQGTVRGWSMVPTLS